jgi:hypothetical protein
MKRFYSVRFHSLILILCFGANCNLWAAEESSVSQEVEIDVFSGRPNPVFNLLPAELQEFNQFLSKAKIEKANEDIKAELIPSILGYRGLRIRERGDNKAALSEIQVVGKDILVRGRSESRHMKASDDSLEKYLVDLALAKGAIDKGLHKEIRQAMQKRQANGS